MAKKAKPKQPAKPKGDGGKRAAKDQAAKTKRAATGTKAVKAAKNSGVVTADQVRRVANADELKRLMKLVRSLLSDASTASSEAGQKISEASKQNKVNAAAFRIILRLLNTGGRDPNKLRVLLDDFDYYRDVFKLDELAGDSLFAGREGAEDGGEEGTEEEPREPQGANVVALNNGGGNGEARPSAA